MPDSRSKTPLSTATADSRKDVLDRLRGRGADFTAAERTIAAYILDNVDDVAYETAASLAERLGVSSATIGRFCRSLGYRHFRALKEAIRRRPPAPPWLTGQKFETFVAQDRDEQWLPALYNAEIAALTELYQLPRTPEWERVVDMLANAPRLWIAGFQTERGMALMLALELQYLRPGVHIVDGASGHFADALEDGSEDCILILDVHRYSRQSIELAARAKERGKRLVIITDRSCLWAAEYTRDILTVPIHSESVFWVSKYALSSLVHLLIDATVRALGDRVLERLETVSDLYRGFTGYTEQPGAPEPARRPAAIRTRRADRSRK